MRTRLVLAIVMSVVIGSAAAASASLGQGSLAERQIDGFAVRAYSQDYGVTRSEARERLASMDEITDRVMSVVETEGDRVAGWGILHEPEFTGWVLLAGDEPATWVSLQLAESSDDLKIEVGAKHTYSELRAALMNFDEIDHQIASQGLMVTSRGISMRDNSLRIGVASMEEMATAAPAAKGIAAEEFAVARSVEAAGIPLTLVEHPATNSQTVFWGGNTSLCRRPMGQVIVLLDSQLQRVHDQGCLRLAIVRIPEQQESHDRFSVTTTWRRSYPQARPASSMTWLWAIDFGTTTEMLPSTHWLGPITASTSGSTYREPRQRVSTQFGNGLTCSVTSFATSESHLERVAAQCSTSISTVKRTSADLRAIACPCTSQ